MHDYEKELEDSKTPGGRLDMKKSRFLVGPPPLIVPPEPVKAKPRIPSLEKLSKTTNPIPSDPSALKQFALPWKIRKPKKVISKVNHSKYEYSQIIVSQELSSQLNNELNFVESYIYIYIYIYIYFFADD